MLRALAIDFNSFFASVEQQERPELRGKPVAVVPVLAETTGCIAVSIEAKAMGMDRNARVSEARLQCPGLIIVEARPEVYIHYHNRLKEVVETCAPIKKIQSIDELECELSGDLAQPLHATALAEEMRQKIYRAVGRNLRCSIGVGPNWFLAKVASDMMKPDGFVLLDDPDIPEKLLRLGLNDFCGIGSNMEKRLNAAGIHTVAQLYAASSMQLRAIWGSVEGARFHGWLRGEAQEREETRHSTIGHGHVLPPEKRNDASALAVLHRLLQKAAMRLRDEHFYAGGLDLSVRYRDGTHWHEGLRFNETQDTLTFIHALNDLWKKRPSRTRGPIQVGLILSHLLAASGHTADLFEYEKEQSRSRLNSAVDLLNQTFGKNSVYFGGAHGETAYAPMRIAFTRIPNPKLENIDASKERRLHPRKKSPAATPDDLPAG